MDTFDTLPSEKGNTSKLDFALLDFAKIPARVVKVYVSLLVIFNFTISFSTLFIFATKLQADDENIEHYLNGYIADLRENILNKNQSTEDILDKLIYQLELDTEPDHKKLNKEEEHLIDFDENDDFTNGTLEGNKKGRV